jgi:two-component system phosphate regulon response regulator PhoB
MAGAPVKSTRNILLVEDEGDLADLLQYNLEREGYKCRVVHDGAGGIAEIRRQAPHLLILDRMLPNLSGDEVIAQVRKEPQTSAIPIIMLTAKAEESDELVGFALGADDYITKPFSMKLLIARVAAVLRRTEGRDFDSEVLSSGPIKLDSSRFEVAVHGQPVSLTAMEFRVLKALMSARGRVLRRSDLIDKVLGTSVAVTDRTIDVHITALRKKLGEASPWIKTVRGVGYAFREPTSD